MLSTFYIYLSFSLKRLHHQVVTIIQAVLIARYYYWLRYTLPNLDSFLTINSYQNSFKNESELTSIEIWRFFTHLLSRSCKMQVFVVYCSSEATHACMPYMLNVLTLWHANWIKLNWTESTSTILF